MLVSLLLFVVTVCRTGGHESDQAAYEVAKKTYCTSDSADWAKIESMLICYTDASKAVIAKPNLAIADCLLVAIRIIRWSRSASFKHFATHNTQKKRFAVKTAQVQSTR